MIFNKGHSDLEVEPKNNVFAMDAATLTRNDPRWALYFSGYPCPA